jgi:hypothetical protein
MPTDDDSLSEEELEPFRNLAEHLDDDGPVGDFCRAVVQNHTDE